MSTVQPAHIRPGQAIYLILATDRGAEAATLRALWERRTKSSAEKDALWSGYYELRRLAQNAIDDVVRKGALLFFGQQAAIHEARHVNDAVLQGAQRGAA
ncbi:hypothetical protein [Delftia sp.]|uniref:hypothetical protein n=1 Tax=Delftia sp. TaxID=1886637 RepID=UPI00259C8152|nr:hypothetical protein [Delftia sp.]